MMWRICRRRWRMCRKSGIRMLSRARRMRVRRTMMCISRLMFTGVNVYFTALTRPFCFFRLRSLPFVVDFCINRFTLSKLSSVSPPCTISAILGSMVIVQGSSRFVSESVRTTSASMLSSSNWLILHSKFRYLYFHSS